MTNDAQQHDLRALCQAQQGPMLALLETLSRRHEDAAKRGEVAGDGSFAAHLQSLTGLQLEEDPAAPKGMHFSTSVAGASPEQDGWVALLAPRGIADEPAASFAREGDRLSGREVGHTLGGLVLGLCAMQLLRDSKAPCGRRVQLLCPAQSHDDVAGAAAFLRRRLAGARATLVLGPGRADDATITSRHGHFTMAVVAHGIAAHSGNHHADGANAIWALSRFVERLRAFNDPAAGVVLAVTSIEGGQSRNTVPERSDAAIRVCFADPAAAPALQARLEALAESSADALPKTKISVTFGPTHPPIERSAATGTLADAYGRCAQAAGLRAGEAEPMLGSSLAEVSAAMGIATIDGLGPRCHGAGTSFERIEAASMAHRLEALLRYLKGGAI